MDEGPHPLEGPSCWATFVLSVATPNVSQGKVEGFPGPQAIQYWHQRLSTNSEKTSVNSEKMIASLHLENY